MKHLTMRYLLFLLFIAAGNPCLSQSRAFRYANVVEVPYDLVHDTKAWQFDAGAPIRATPLVHNGTVYFGTAKGSFFALDKKTARVKWQYDAGSAIHSSAAVQGEKLYFSDNGQLLYCLAESDGQLLWKQRLGRKQVYPWRFDYYYSSPVLHAGKIFIGSDDGHLYALDAVNGRILWQFRAKGIVRCTPAIDHGKVLFGDTEGNFYSLDMNTGRQNWIYKVMGEPLLIDTIGFDRKGIMGAPTVSGDKVLFGSRDGYLYCLDVANGRPLWTVNHNVSWVISAVAVKDSIVVTGTSDGRFIQAVSLHTGRQIWKYNTALATWSSPLIVNDRVYEGCFDGQLLCLDLKTGHRISQFMTNGIILSSPVIDDSLLYIGSDDGSLYAIKGHAPVKQVVQRRLVYYDAQQVKLYFQNGGDIRIRNYLRGNGFTTIGTDTLPRVMANPEGTVIVFATGYFPKSIYEKGNRSLLRQFLDGGGRVVLLGNNPLFYEVDEATAQIRNYGHQIDSVLGLDYGPVDTRAFGGLYPAFPTNAGEYFGLPAHWVSYFGIDPGKVSKVLGKNENGQASAFIKNYNNKGRLVQLWMQEDMPVHMDAIIKLAEWEL